MKRYSFPLYLGVDFNPAQSDIFHGNDNLHHDIRCLKIWSEQCLNTWAKKIPQNVCSWYDMSEYIWSCLYPWGSPHSSVCCAYSLSVKSWSAIILTFTKKSVLNHLVNPVNRVELQFLSPSGIPAKSWPWFQQTVCFLATLNMTHCADDVSLCNLYANQHFQFGNHFVKNYL